jgi:hypothetical protein
LRVDAGGVCAVAGVCVGVPLLAALSARMFVWNAMPWALRELAPGVVGVSSALLLVKA